MKYYPHPILAREGWTFILLSLIITFLIWHFSNFYIALPFILISIFIIQFFRDPKRAIPTAPNLILCPADGRVICVEECLDPYQNVEALKVSIFMNILGTPIKVRQI